MDDSRRGKYPACSVSGKEGRVDDDDANNADAAGILPGE
jgi:hypothetical protein